MMYIYLSAKPVGWEGQLSQLHGSGFFSDSSIAAYFVVAQLLLVFSCWHSLSAHAKKVSYTETVNESAQLSSVCAPGLRTPTDRHLGISQSNETCGVAGGDAGVFVFLAVEPNAFRSLRTLSLSLVFLERSIRRPLSPRS